MLYLALLSCSLCSVKLHVVLLFVEQIKKEGTRSPAIASMADHTTPVVKLTPNLTLSGHNLSKTGTFPLNGPIMRRNEAYRAIFCTLKTTSDFIFLLPVV